MEFNDWLKNIYNRRDGSNIALSSVNKYNNAVNTINNEMLDDNVIDKSLFEMNKIELDIALDKILHNEEFLKKNRTGNNMYSCALKRYRCYKHYTENDDEIMNEILTVYKPTERKQITKSRIGQEKFKKELLKKYNNRCVITNLSIQQVLIASHIKPWAVSNNAERLDVNNGLLLSASFDKLFDSGLITFNEYGKIVISSLVSKNDLKILNINNGMKFDIKVDGRMKEYLKYHHDMIFVS